jgi:hypothetical protein
MQFSEDELIDALKRLAEQLGRTPRARDADAHPNVATRRTYITRFGSWRNALEAAGIPLDPRSTGYDRETLLAHLRDLAKDLERTPTLGDLKAVDGPCGATYESHFGSWTAALSAAGLEPGPRSKRYSRDELLSVLQELAAKLGHAPSMAELWERDDLPTPSTYKYRFGRWNAALEEAGLVPRHRAHSRSYLIQTGQGSWLERLERRKET